MKRRLTPKDVPQIHFTITPISLGETRDNPQQLNKPKVFSSKLKTSGIFLITQTSGSHGKKIKLRMQILIFSKLPKFESFCNYLNIWGSNSKTKTPPLIINTLPPERGREKLKKTKQNRLLSLHSLLPPHIFSRKFPGKSHPCLSFHFIHFLYLSLYHFAHSALSFSPHPLVAGTRSFRTSSVILTFSF